MATPSVLLAHPAGAMLPTFCMTRRVGVPCVCQSVLLAHLAGTKPVTIVLTCCGNKARALHVSKDPTVAEVAEGPVWHGSLL